MLASRRGSPCPGYGDSLARVGIQKVASPFIEMALVPRIGRPRDAEQRLVYIHLGRDAIRAACVPRHHEAAPLALITDGGAVRDLISQPLFSCSDSRGVMSGHGDRGMTMSHAPESTVTSISCQPG